MNAPARAAVPLLEDYPFRLTDNVRFADLDPNNHVNNAVYSSYFETSRVMLTKDSSYGLTPDGLSWVLVKLDIHFRAELHWPGTIELGTGIEKIGRTSLTFAQVVFSGGKCIASSSATTVMVGLQSRQPTAIPADTITRLQPWMLRRAATA
ncbi:acyl-CoA thioesterase [Tardiphaga alba]|uniref:Acyl-CoA thioesterase n=1 Tax=Tardiphaga alba TaxID=340268 RepID=A0ABX8ADF7_9BRAD|nr:thioesterase family protein [Tardiphaga alba]QUS41006.1 acyl-CoA thioesterase [Tardiphaga alba]